MWYAYPHCSTSIICWRLSSSVLVDRGDCRAFGTQVCQDWSFYIASKSLSRQFCFGAWPSAAQYSSWAQNWKECKKKCLICLLEDHSTSRGWTLLDFRTPLCSSGWRWFLQSQSYLSLLEYSQCSDLLLPLSRKFLSREETSSKFPFVPTPGRSFFWVFKK